MNLKRNLKELFSFSKKERVANIILIPAILLIAVFPFLKKHPSETNTAVSDSAWVVAANILQQNETNEPNYAQNSTTNAAGYAFDKTENVYESTPKGTLFNFDPNTLDADGFKKLGLRDKTIQTLLNYRNKGGRFRKPADLAKIYGLHPQEFERLQPFVNIVNQNTNSLPINSNTYATNKPYKNQEFKPSYKPRSIDVNTADIAEFETLYGIGNKLATKIVNFRTKLGGFYTIDQVGETYGVPDSTFQKIKSQLKLSAIALKKIDINTAGYDEINNHPYINNRTAYQILKYRKEKGLFSNIDEVQSLVQTGDSFEKIAPYIKVN